MSAGNRSVEIESIKREIQASLNEDSINLQWTLAKVDRLAWVRGRGVYSSLLLLLANLTLEEEEAKQTWDAILKHRARLERSLDRRVALRVALLDYLVEINSSTMRPRMLEVIQIGRASDTEMIDQLTGLHTRRFLEEQVPREMARARRYTLPLSYVHIEVDDFPRWTEDLGPTIGTFLAKEIAVLVASSIRNIDYAARLSASEFALLLTETERMGAYHVAERIRQKVEEVSLEGLVGGRPFGLGISAGVASFPQDAGRPEDLPRRAREAFYTARTRGRNRVAIHHPERREFIRLTIDEQDLQVSLVPDGAGPTATGTMRNISSGGILFESIEPIPLGRMVHLLCRNRREADQVLIPGKVVRIEAFETEGGERYEIGVLFDIVVEEQLEGVIEFIERLSSGGDGAAAPESENPGAP